MSYTIQKLNTPKKTGDLTREHFQFLAYLVRQESINRLEYPPVRYYVAKHIPAELISGELIYEDKNIPGLLRPTKRGTNLLIRFPSFANLRRDSGMPLEVLDHKPAKAARRDR